MKFGFVILHYLAIDMTKECIDTLLMHFSRYNIQIAVVDNCSSNDSGVQLKKHYEGNPQVKVLLHSKNDGFARGNNVGFSYLKETFFPDFIIVMNNDVLIEDQAFLDKIEKVYAEQKYYVLGPDIINPFTNIHQNPAHQKGFTLEEINALKSRLENVNRHIEYYQLRSKIGSIIKPNKKPQNSAYETQQINPVLHGACYIFSKLFIEKRNYCFHPGTFLYMEEDILHFECMRDQMKMIYSPLLQVKHLEDVSTNMVNSSPKKKRIAKNTEMLKSIEVLISLMSE